MNHLHQPLKLEVRTDFEKQERIGKIFFPKLMVNQSEKLPILNNIYQLENFLLTK